MESSQALVVEETGRRKRPRNGGDEEGSMWRRRLNAWEDDGRVVEEEVEEFFAILRRMHDAVTWFSVKKENASSKWREERDGRKGWKPKFLMEDFEAASSVKRKAHTDDEGGRTAERVAEKEIHGCLDLNAEPTPEGNVVILP